MVQSPDPIILYKVSVIVPTYNHGAYLGACLDSLEAQTTQDFEIIVVDDASTDNTSEIVEGYQTFFGQRLTYLKLEKRVGRGEVRNYGLRSAKGEYITFLDADDAYAFTKIEVESKYLDEHPDAGGVSCRYYFVNSALREPERETGETTATFALLFGENYSKFEEGTPALMVRRRVIDRVGYFDGNIARGQDTDMMVRLARVSRIDTLDTRLYLYRQHEANKRSLQGLRERTMSNVVLFRKIIDSEHDLRKDLARRFALVRLMGHVYRLRELTYSEAMIAWCVYLCKFSHDLPIGKWAMVGLKALLGYRCTQLVKSKILPGFLRPKGAGQRV